MHIESCADVLVLYADHMCRARLGRIGDCVNVARVTLISILQTLPSPTWILKYWPWRDFFLFEGAISQVPIWSFGCPAYCLIQHVKTCMPRNISHTVSYKKNRDPSYLLLLIVIILRINFCHGSGLSPIFGQSRFISLVMFPNQQYFIKHHKTVGICWLDHS